MERLADRAADLMVALKFVSSSEKNLCGSELPA
jgi:hypothetical protein